MGLRLETTAAARLVHHGRSLWPGLLAAVTVAMAALFLAGQHGGPTMLYALLLGMALSFMAQESSTAAGVEAASKQVLRIGVALLGARIGMDQVLALGWQPVLAVVSLVVATLLVGRLLGRWLGLSASQSVLAGGAVAICGASAALAIASVLPKTPGRDRDTVFTVATVTALGTLTMVLYPPLATLIGLDATTAGIFLGGTIHDVAQVVGAGYTISPVTGDTATIAKLLRVAMLAPVILALAPLFRDKAAAPDDVDTTTRLPLPPFLIAFVVIASANSVGILPDTVTAAAGTVSKWCLVCAIAAIGMKTQLASLVRVGWRTAAAMLGATIFMAASMLTAIFFGAI